VLRPFSRPPPTRCAGHLPLKRGRNYEYLIAPHQGELPAKPAEGVLRPFSRPPPTRCAGRLPLKEGEELLSQWRP